MKLNDFEGMKPDEVRGVLGEASETEKLDVLVGLVMRNRSQATHRALCPGCKGGHDRARGKFTDRSGRVWHVDCVAGALANLEPDHPKQTPIALP